MLLRRVTNSPFLFVLSIAIPARLRPRSRFALVEFAPLWLGMISLGSALPGCGSQEPTDVALRPDANSSGSSGGSGSPSFGGGYEGGASSTGVAGSSGGDSADASAESSSGGDGGSGGSSSDSGGSSGSVLDGGGAACGASHFFGGGPITTTTTHLDIGVHDPSMIWDGSRYYLLSTGGTLGVRSSPDILTWASAGNVFSAVPSWITAALGENPGSLWAPDISYYSGQFHVYYAGSTFGSNSSVIGLATTPTLASPSWVDDGLVIQSKTTDDFNAIDPSVTFDETCTPWLAFGSFWSGIKMRKLDAATGKPASDDTTLYSLAARPNDGDAIEASSIVSHNGFYYLFASFDACCKGVNSTYNTNVGRATKVTGPYTDKAGVDMMQGGGDRLLATSGRYIGPGGGTAWRDGNTYLYVYHYYDGDDNGNSKLQVRPIAFDANDWVTLSAPLFP
jgi:arabinan endo-1,5-alpha-L-arabinosidase